MPDNASLITRRAALQQSVGAALMLWASKAAGAPAAESPAASRPNILFCIADDWSFPHAGAYGDPVVKTPAFDRVAREGVLFTHAFCASPSCTPSRGGILTGQAIHRLKEGGNLWSFLRKEFVVYPDVLEAAGYFVGLQGKGWGPGDFKAGGRERNPAGPNFKSFQQFLDAAPEGKPFCFWYGSTDPHRAYEEGSGARAGLKADDVRVPPFFPDTAEVSSDILDYYFEVERYDRSVGEILAALEQSGRAENTLVVVTSDNGMPFPRCKANVYDCGTRMPLAIRWPARVKGGRTSDAFASLTDIAPTFLEAVGLEPLREMTGRSLLGLLDGREPQGRDEVFVERERHANVRRGNASYPCRAVRTKQFLYIRNLRPDRWPAGDPEKWMAVGRYGDVDDSPTKNFILDRREEPGMRKFHDLAFAKRPPEELYDLEKDPSQVNNVAGRPEYAAAQAPLRAALDRWMKETADPRAEGETDVWDGYPYTGGAAKKAPAAKRKQ